ncbi:exodeoxyribonuclease V subunit beta [Pseudidiomarina aestuarii]|uniref:RecBCD enzyme subunit RecB n=2 Tax=Pseudidiomarina aestuarii TaxID=624146 RepID=A0A2T4CVC0_9GAMM|nr:exodeoxyribonuclease V subunit beta [Pseudidiomarina aestuarii]PTB90385.1 exodeoxyribonuclease V subunit beta [Pseudidiomarina aestuarii]
MSDLLNPLTVPLHGSRLIEASAGTGKTYTIAALYLRLILGHGEGIERTSALRPEDILVVTFTEAATEELRDRIRARLSEAASYFRQQIDIDDEFLQALRADYAESQWALLARRLDLAAQSMDEAAVHTIHGWCNRMLREHAFSTGSLFTQQLNTDNDELWLTVAQDYWRTFVASLRAEQQAHYLLFTNKFGNPEELLKSTRGLIQAPLTDSDAGDAKSPTDIITERFQAEQRLREQHHQLPWRSFVNDLREFLERHLVAKHFNGHKVKSNYVATWLQVLETWVDSLDRGDALLAPELTDAARRRLSEEGIREAAKVELADMPNFALLEDLYAAVEQLPDVGQPLLQHAAQWLRQRFRMIQAQRAEMGFDDMLTRLRDALSGPQGEQLATVIRTQFPVAMIDEFQDTDPVQYRIFDTVYRLAQNDPNTGLFIIGDPKQAIYSFRYADIYSYLEARAATAGRHYTLAKNFRSSAAMVAATNALFEHAEQTPQGAFRFATTADNPVPFRPVAAHGRKDTWVVQGSEAPALKAFVHEVKGKPNKEELRATVSARCAEQIVNLLSDATCGFQQADGSINPVRPSDIAILVANGKEAKKIRDALRARGVRSVYLSDRDSVFANPLAIDVLHILNASANPREPQRIRTALATALLGLSLTDLDALATDEMAWDAMVDRFTIYHELWQQKGVLAVLHACLHDFSVPAQLLRSDDGERQLTDVLHMAELLQQQSTLQDGMAGLLRYLADHIRHAREGNQQTNSAEQQVRLESDSELVQVITIHKSKGLQYPLVFLPFIADAKPFPGKSNFPAAYHDEQGLLKFVFSKDDQTGVARTEHERLAEDVRKLYVALTRAQYATYVDIAPFPQWSQSALATLLVGDDAELKGTDGIADLHIEGLAFATVTNDHAKTTYQQAQAERSAAQVCTFPAERQLERWWLASYSALTYGDWIPTAETTQQQNATEAERARALEEQVEASTQTPREMHAFPKGAQAGTFLHNLLEAAAHQGFASVQQNPRALVEQTATMAPWLEHQNVLTNWLGSYLTTPFELDGSVVTLAGLTVYQAEPEFWFAAQQVSATAIDSLVKKHTLQQADRPSVLPTQLNGMLKGFIDLVFEHEGRYYVADYKSNYLGPDASAYFTEAMRNKIIESRYDLQYVIYTLALHRLLRARLGADYHYETHVGGAVYLFMRGYRHETGGAFFERPPWALIEALDDLFAGTKPAGSDQ